MPRAEKEQKVREIAGELQGSTAAVLAGFRGLTVQEAGELRGALLDVGARFAVVKNSLGKLAVREAGIDGLEDLFEGPTAVTYVKEDAVAAAKRLVEQAKKFPVIEIRGGFAEGRVLTADDIRAMATLDSREVMLAQIAGLAKLQMSRAASMFQSLQGKFARLLLARADQLPPEEAAAPEAATPPEAAAPEPETPDEAATAEAATAEGADAGPQDAASDEPADAGPGEAATGESADAGPAEAMSTSPEETEPQAEERGAAGAEPASAEPAQDQPVEPATVAEPDQAPTEEPASEAPAEAAEPSLEGTQPEAEAREELPEAEETEAAGPEEPAPAETETEPEAPGGPPGDETATEEEGGT